MPASRKQKTDTRPDVVSPLENIVGRPQRTWIARADAIHSCVFEMGLVARHNHLMPRQEVEGGRRGHRPACACYKLRCKDNFTALSLS